MRKIVTLGGGPIRRLIVKLDEAGGRWAQNPEWREPELKLRADPARFTEIDRAFSGMLWWGDREDRERARWSLRPAAITEEKEFASGACERLGAVEEWL